MFLKGPKGGSRGSPSVRNLWEIDFYTPPVLGDAALFIDSAPAMYKIQGP